jgi:hypothetical protein
MAQPDPCVNTNLTKQSVVKSSISYSGIGKQKISALLGYKGLSFLTKTVPSTLVSFIFISLTYKNQNFKTALKLKAEFGLLKTLKSQI